MGILDILSISVGLSYITPLILYANTYDITHITYLCGILITNVISEYSKLYIIKDKSKRPQGAYDCNLLCNDGNQSGQPGFPSSHSATVTFFTFVYIFYYKNIYVTTILISYAIFVMLSRYLKRCHTIIQIGGGIFLGVLTGLIFVR